MGGPVKKFSYTLALEENDLIITTNKEFAENDYFSIEFSRKIGGKTMPFLLNEWFYSVTQEAPNIYRVTLDENRCAAYAGENFTVDCYIYSHSEEMDYEAPKQSFTIPISFASEEPLPEISYINYDPISRTVTLKAAEGDIGDIIASYVTADGNGRGTGGTDIGGTIDSHTEWCKKYGKKYTGIIYSFRISQGGAYSREISIKINPDGSWSEVGSVAPEAPGAGKDTTPPEQVTGLAIATGATGKSTTLKWNTASDDTGVTQYEIYIDGKKRTSKKTFLTVKNLGSGEHSFQVYAVDKAKNRSDVSETFTFWAADVTSPKTGKITLEQSASEALTVSWTAGSDDLGINHYLVTCGNQEKIVGASELSVEFQGISGKATASVTAYDEAGNAGKTVKKTLNMKDMTAPTQVSGLRSEGVDNKSGGILAWNAASDNVGVTQYLISVEGGKTYKSKTSSVKVKKMAAGTYRYTVVALDKAKNQSIVSTAGEFTVADVIDPKIKKLSCKVNGQTALVSWNATDEVGIARSELWLDGARYADTTGLTSFSLGSLELGQHSVELKVWDAAGNMAVKMANLNIKTADPVMESAGLLASI